MQNSQEHLKTMVYAEFRGQTECIMGNWKIENTPSFQNAPIQTGNSKLVVTRLLRSPQFSNIRSLYAIYSKQTLPPLKIHANQTH